MAKSFKARWRKHRDSMLIQDPKNSTTLSIYYWEKLEGGQDPKLTWKILEANITNYNPIKKECRLCIREKFNIALKPHLATLNSRNEMFAHCRHMEAKLIKKPPD